MPQKYTKWIPKSPQDIQMSPQMTPKSYQNHAGDLYWSYDNNRRPPEIPKDNNYHKKSTKNIPNIIKNHQQINKGKNINNYSLSKLLSTNISTTNLPMGAGGRGEALRYNQVNLVSKRQTL